MSSDLSILDLPSLLPMPMLTLTGRVDNIFLSDDSVDKISGVVNPGTHRLQLVCDIPLKNGQFKREVQTVKTDYPDFFRSMEGRKVSLPVAVYVLDSKTFGFYVLKSWRPPLVVAPSVAA